MSMTRGLIWNLKLLAQSAYCVRYYVARLRARLFAIDFPKSLAGRESLLRAD